jgi:hypothetical protein
MKTSQAWSMDIMMAFIIFIGTIFIFYSIISNRQSEKEDELQEEALRVLENLNITGNISQINELLGENYSQLKKKLRVENEFCIFFEDEKGNIIYINPADPNQPGIGSEKIRISDEPCK